MNTYYIAGLPCSDELYHHGVRDQKWGVRRYQYEDRTLTPLGKTHYAAMRAASKAAAKAGGAAKKVAKAVGSKVSRAAHHKVLEFKSKHRWMMSDQELEEYTKRLKLETTYRDLMESNRKPVSKGKQFAGDLMRDVGRKVTLSLIDRVIKAAEFKQKQYQDEERFYAENARKRREELRKKRETNEENSKKQSYKLAKETLSMLEDAKRNGTRTLTNEQLQNRIERINLLRKLEDPSGGVQAPTTVARMLKEINKK